MYKRVDDVCEEELEGFVYSNLYSEDEYVTLGSDTVTINAYDTKVGIYTLDVPKLVRALKAAYKHQTGAEIE